MGTLFDYYGITTTAEPPKPAKEPSLWERAKRGMESTVSAGQIALAGRDELAGLVAEDARSQLPQTEAAKRMQAEAQPYVDRANQAEGWDAVGAWASLTAKRLSQFVMNPGEFAGMVAENLPNSAPGIAGSLAGGAAGGTVGPVGAAVGAVAGGTAGGYLVEQGAAMREQILKEASARGIDSRDAGALAPLIAEKYDEFIEKAQLKGIGTAATDAVLNRLTLGIAGAGERAIIKDAGRLADGIKAGRVGAEAAAARVAELQARQAARNTLGSRVARGAGVTGMEMVGEGASEAAGQLLAYGEADAGDVVDEALLGMGQGAGMALGEGAVQKTFGVASRDDAAAAVQAAADAAQARITGASSVDDALKAFNEATANAFDEGAGLANIERQRAENQRAMGVPPEGAATVTDAPLLDRLLDLRTQLGDEGTRQRVRAAFGDEGLSEALYYLNLADKPGGEVPDALREKLLGVAESILSRATLKPVPTPQAAPGRNAFGADQAPRLEASEQAPRLGMSPALPAIGMDGSPSGIMVADAAGNVRPQTRFESISLADQERADRERRETLGEQAPSRQTGAILRPDDVPALTYDTSPTGTLRVDSQGRVAPETRADAINTRQAREERESLGVSTPRGDSKAPAPAQAGPVPLLRIAQDRSETGRLIADADGAVRPELRSEQVARDNADAAQRRAQELAAELGLTPDVRRAAERRANLENGNAGAGALADADAAGAVGVPVGRSQAGAGSMGKTQGPALPATPDAAAGRGDGAGRSGTEQPKALSEDELSALMDEAEALLEQATPAQRHAAAQAAGLDTKPPQQRGRGNVTDSAYMPLLNRLEVDPKGVRDALERAIHGEAAAAPASQAGEGAAGEWRAFGADSGTKGIPRADMPQVRAEHRGAMVNFLNARGIAHQADEVAAESLKPTQAEYSTAKVQKAKDYTGGERSILVSSDGHVLDGHHQWVAAREQGKPVKVIRLDAPIERLLDEVKQFPSVERSDGATQAAAQQGQDQLEHLKSLARQAAIERMDRENGGIGSLRASTIRYSKKGKAQLARYEAEELAKRKGELAKAERKAAQGGKRGPAVDVERDTLLVAVAKMGGIRRDELAREFGLAPEELKARVRAGNLSAYPFRVNGGMSIDGAIERLAELGYFDGVPEDERRRELEAAIFEELGGSGRLSTAGQMRRANELGAERAELDAAEGLDPAELDELDELAAEAGIGKAGLATLDDGDLQELDADIPFDAGDSRLERDQRKIMQALGFTQEEIDEATQDRAEQAGAEGEQGRAQSEGRDGGQDSGDAAGQAQPAAGAGGQAPRRADAREGLSDGAPADAQLNTTEAGLPAGVRDRVRSALNMLRDWHRTAAANGPVMRRTLLADNLAGILRQLDSLATFREAAARQGYDAERVIDRIGPEPQLRDLLPHADRQAQNLANDERLVLLCCGETKLDRAAPARELYTGPTWQTFRTHAPADLRNVAVVSAKYGLVHGDEQLATYEQPMTLRQQAMVRAALPEQAGQLGERLAKPVREVIIVGGVDYRSAQVDAVLRLMQAGKVAPDANIIQVDGQIGEQRQRLGELLRAMPKGGATTQLDELRQRTEEKNAELLRKSEAGEPELADTWPDFAARWRDQAERKVAGWGLVDNDLDSISRITLAKGNQLASFYYRKGDQADRERATRTAEAWAKGEKPADPQAPDMTDAARRAKVNAYQADPVAYTAARIPEVLDKLGRAGVLSRERLGNNLGDPTQIGSPIPDDVVDRAIERLEKSTEVFVLPKTGNVHLSTFGRMQLKLAKLKQESQEFNQREADKRAARAELAKQGEALDPAKHKLGARVRVLMNEGGNYNGVGEGRTAVVLSEPTENGGMKVRLDPTPRERTVKDVWLGPGSRVELVEESKPAAELEVSSARERGAAAPWEPGGWEFTDQAPTAEEVAAAAELVKVGMRLQTAYGFRAEQRVVSVTRAEPGEWDGADATARTIVATKLDDKPRQPASQHAVFARDGKLWEESDSPDEGGKFSRVYVLDGRMDREAGDNLLSAQTDDELRQRETDRSRADKADQQEQKRLADKAKADAELGEFTLTGSDSPADIAAAAGQADLFAANAEPDPATMFDGDRVDPADQLPNDAARSRLDALERLIDCLR